MRLIVLVLALVGAGLLWAGSRSLTDGASPVGAATPPSPARITLGVPRPLQVESIAEGLDTPWDMIWGPDGRIWFTERDGRVSAVDPATRSVEVLGDFEVRARGEGGLMGLALHPDFENQPWVYLAHTATESGRTRNRLVRARFEGGRLGPPEVLLSDIPGAGNHNGSRLVFGPDGSLYMTTGDASHEPNAPDPTSLAGKILRLRPDGAPDPTNPSGSAVFSYGHRNPQGLAFHPNGLLYSSEHGPGRDDELNLIEMGRDYGWPVVRGPCDGEPSREIAYCRDHDVAEPLEVWSQTVGISGLDVYVGGLMPEWHGSLLVTSLRGAALFRLTLSEDGLRVVDRETLVRGQYGRLRDVLVGPRGEIYVATSNRDGRGRPATGDDRILLLSPEPQ